MRKEVRQKGRLEFEDDRKRKEKTEPKIIVPEATNYGSEQDQAVRPTTKNKANLRHHLGRTLHQQRRHHSLTIAEVASLARLSRGMLSKIENGQVAATLDTVAKIAEVLGIRLSQLFQGYDAAEGGAQLVRTGQGMEVVRTGTKKGHTYHLLAYNRGPRKLFEPFLITMNNRSEAFPGFKHEGTEFIYMLQGKLEYRHGEHLYLLGPGDALTFPGGIIHGPERLLGIPIRFLSVIVYGDEV
jgi:transcriptional regulator with XRE-family HTH domain